MSDSANSLYLDLFLWLQNFFEILFDEKWQDVFKN